MYNNDVVILLSTLLSMQSTIQSQFVVNQLKLVAVVINLEMTFSHLTRTIVVSNSVDVDRIKGVVLIDFKSSGFIRERPTWNLILKNNDYVNVHINEDMIITFLKSITIKFFSKNNISVIHLKIKYRVASPSSTSKYPLYLFM